jgi:hypothetical protein
MDNFKQILTIFIPWYPPNCFYTNDTRISENRMPTLVDVLISEMLQGSYAQLLFLQIDYKSCLRFLRICSSHLLFLRQCKSLRGPSKAEPVMEQCKQKASEASSWIHELRKQKLISWIMEPLYLFCVAQRRSKLDHWNIQVAELCTHHQHQPLLDILEPLY